VFRKNFRITIEFLSTV